MTNKKSTKRALLMSALSLLLCCSMLIGTTFAWFTDEVTSGVNQIIAGNLDVEVYNSLTVGEKKVDSTTKLFDEIKLWEPGVVAYENLTVANVGNLALKYQLSVNFENATQTPAGKTLADVLKVGFVKDGIKSTTREGALAEVKEWLPLASFAQNGDLLKSESDTYGIVIYWQPGENDNDYNMNNGQTTVLSIDLGIQLVATQLMNEDDSFGNDYDADAILPWDGSADTDWYTGDKDEYVLYTAEELAGLSKLVFDGDNFSGKTVKLGADINLGNMAWTPIGRMINTSDTGENATFKGNFDGQGNTVYNLNVDTVDEVSDTNKGAGLFGAITGNISNVNVVNATINTNHWAGVIAGSIEGSITNCSVTNATVTCLTEKIGEEWDNGDKAGAIAGYATSGTIENCTVTNATITAYRDLGAIVGASYNSLVKCTVSNVTLIKDNTNDYKGTADDTTVNEYIGTAYGEATADAEGEVIIYADANTKYIASAAQLVAFAEEVNGGNTYEGKTVALIADIDLADVAWTPINNFKGTFDGKGHTISNLTVKADKYAGLFGYLKNSGATITNLTVDGADVTANTVDTDGYAGAVLGYHFSSGTRITISDVTVTNSTITGKNGGAVAGSACQVTISNCASEKNTINASRNGGIIGTTLETSTVTGCTVSGNTQNIQLFETESAAYIGNIVARPSTASTIQSDNVTEKRDIAEAADDTTLDEAIRDGNTIIVLGSGNYIIPDSAQGKTLTIIGNGETVVATQDDGSYEGCDYSLDGATVTFEGITINTDSSTYTGYARLKATYNNCTINGTYTLYGDSTFNNCTFNVTGDVYNIWTWGAPTATFNNCTFNSDGKAMLLYSTVNTKLTLNNCVFNDNGGLTDLKAAVEIGNDYGVSYELIVNNTTVNGYEINDKGISTGTTLWANKNSMGTDKLNVVVDGVDVY